MQSCRQGVHPGISCPAVPASFLIVSDPPRKHCHFDGSLLFMSAVYKHRVCYGGTWSVQGTHQQLAEPLLVIVALQGFMGD